MKGQWEEAISAYRSAQAQNPNSPIVSYNIGNALYREGKFDEALTELSHSTSTFKNVKLRSFAHYNRGVSLYRNRDGPAAIEEFKKALLLNPADEDAKFNIEFIRSDRQRNQSSKNSGGSNSKDKNQKQASAQKGEDKSASQKNPEALSKEDAERILSAIREQERQAFQSKNTPKPLPEQSPGGKDW